MSGISSWLWGTSQLDDAVDKATSELLPSGAEDIALNLEICDQIRSKSVPAKDAMRALKRRLNHKNPNVQLLALGLTDICIKNGGDHFLIEVASREFIDNLVSILKMPALNLEVKSTILRLIQNWSVAFEGKPSLLYVTQVYKTLNMEGFTFPPKDLTITNSAMVDTQTAPEWIDSDVCLRCRDPFTFTNRKHHCRNCGQVFDQKCSSKSIPLPHFGIAQDVRVCDGCYSKIHKKAEKANKTHRHSTSLHGNRHRSARDLADAELQRAIQLSLQETGLNGASRPGYIPSPPTWQYSEPPLVDRTTHPRPPVIDEENDPDLKAAIEASLREANAPKPSAPIALETPRSEAPSEYSGPGYSQSYPPGVVPPHPSLPKLPNYDLEPLESDTILTFSQTIEQVQTQGGRDISRYPAVNELYDKANSLRPKLAMSLDDAGRKEEMLADMHDKLSQAVKLYDQLLSEQVAHPRWRSSQAYQQPVSNYSQPQPLTNGYSQWQSPYQVASASSPQPAPPPSSYFTPAPAPAQPTPAPPQQYSYAESSQQYLQPMQTAEQATQNTTPISQYYQPEPVPMSPPQQEAPPISYNTYPVSEKRQASPEATYQVPLAPVNVVPVSAPPASSPTEYTPPALTRQNTVSSYSAPTPQPLPSRSNTVHSTYRQPPQQQYAPPPPTLPQFPVAPTSAPQAFSMYEPSIPTGVVQREERQEALLIDL
ncbi:vacuolar sorting-associated protein Vps27 [Armillaria fumosa]|nr:vacuolar sorting-associated protein Vps27 [Armillaria fumosa]